MRAPPRVEQRGHGDWSRRSCNCFFQAEDGIRDVAVTGVQTCALPISALAQRFQASLVGPGQGYRQTLREKVVAGVPGGDLYLVGFGAETDYIMSKNDFSFCQDRKSVV